MHENSQFAIKYCFLIMRNVYSSKKCVGSEINLISLNNHDGLCSGNLRKVSEHLRDYFQPTVLTYMSLQWRFMLHFNVITGFILFLEVQIP